MRALNLSPWSPTLPVSSHFQHSPLPPNNPHGQTIEDALQAGPGGGSRRRRVYCDNYELNTMDDTAGEDSPPPPAHPASDGIVFPDSDDDWDGEMAASPRRALINSKYTD